MEDSFVFVHQKGRDDFERTFQELYEEFAPSILAQVKKKLCRHDFAKDVVQAIFMDLWSRRDQISFENLRPYLMGATHNKCVDLIRKNAIEKRHEENVAYEWKLNEDGGDSEISPDMRRWAQEALAELPERSREIFCMCKYQGMKYWEIADELNVSQKTVETHMYRSFKKLRKSHKKYERFL
ncbi:DNA-directed RNA polymerase sigma-70 factor [Fulvitalea axinellae]|uniref:DNA-directed RNA polymerase sigma-70 factor n=1 Tax=Fulvitalea axinellae TaxID=1182444 RepID=A0AAU9CBH4_9BACT|nr:DNA-directed RNA polymerase sigma-70 factor [Fulvitalea axinellae]